jgi:hypothetical protein
MPKAVPVLTDAPSRGAQSRDGLAVVDAQGRVLYQNEAHQRLLSDSDGITWQPRSPQDQYAELASSPGKRAQFTRAAKKGAAEVYEARSFRVHGKGQRDRNAVIVVTRATDSQAEEKAPKPPA